MAKMVYKKVSTVAFAILTEVRAVYIFEIPLAKSVGKKTFVILTLSGEKVAEKIIQTGNKQTNNHEQANR